jgi:A/G-specific adenine glycosylase
VGHPAHELILQWYSAHRRDLPWRKTTPYGVMVSEFMLQQTPVARVLPVWVRWMDQWPTPSALASASGGEVIRMWDRLGYPRRALRLHAAAQVIVEQHAGEVPRDEQALLGLPGIGEYTAAAIRAFAFDEGDVVLDTNVRRLLARLIAGTSQAAPTINTAERSLAHSLLPVRNAHQWAAATMELGAVVCKSRSPECPSCPVSEICAWRNAGYPTSPTQSRTQAWTGTDRQCRGVIMALLRGSHSPVSRSHIEAAWSDALQSERCLNALIRDGLVELVADQSYALPS